MNMFNELIADLELVAVPFSGRCFTWSNMQDDSLLVKLDWVFTSAGWSLSFPATFVQPLPRPISDHIPYVLHIGSSILKSNLFRFENFWTINLHWNNSAFFANATKNLSRKFKQERAGLKAWSRNLSNLNKLIYNTGSFFCLMDWQIGNLFQITCQKSFSLPAWFKKKQRYTIRWVTLGDENTQFFHSIATISDKRRFIVSLSDRASNIVTDHDQKANLLWSSFKQRPGVSEFSSMTFNLSSFLSEHNLEEIDAYFNQTEIDWVIKTSLTVMHQGLMASMVCFIKEILEYYKQRFHQTLRWLLSA